MDSHFKVYKERLDAKNLSTVVDLENLVRPLIREATRIVVESPTELPQNSQLISHFGGQPYFEEGEQWPKTQAEQPLDFIFQIFNNHEINLPESIALVQFYYDWEEGPWDTEADGWLVKIYEKLDETKRIEVEKPEALGVSNFCPIHFQKIRSLPDWEGIDVYSDDASNLSCVLDTEEPWKHYQNVVEKLIGDLGYQSQIGGYPHWVQGESTPTNSKDESMKLLFQIDSEENAEIMWGDSGLVYVFYDETSKEIEFTFQCF